MTDGFRVAFVGAGYMASEHLRAFAALKNAIISGITSRTRARAEALSANYGCVVTDDVAELFKKTRADIVVVAVNEMQMAEVARACFAYPWTIFLEKPAGYNLENAQRILSDAEATDALGRTFVALNRRGYFSLRTALDELESCDSPRLIRVQDQQDLSAVCADGKTPTEVVENYMFANSIHLIDMMRALARGDVSDVRVVAPWNYQKPSWVVSAIEFTSGDMGLYEGLWTGGPGPWAVSVAVAEKYLEMRPLEEIGVQMPGERRLTPIEKDRRDVDFKPGLMWQAENIACAVAGRPHRLVSLSEAFGSMELVARIFGHSES
jgi:predicted dehydrogenase